jgi:hypothetical protein
MKRHVLLYGLIAGILIAALKWTEYRFLVIEHSIEIYGGLVAATFAALGIWLGLKLTSKQERVVTKEVPVPTGERFRPDARANAKPSASRLASWKYWNSSPKVSATGRSPRGSS